MEILGKHRDLLHFLHDFIYPWRKLTIGIDGADGVGKSPLARFLSWQFGMPSLETDMFLEDGKHYPSLRYDELSKLINWRHSLDRPVIVEGIYLLETLEKIDIKSDVLIYVIDRNFEGSSRLRQELESYREKFSPQEKADRIYEADNEEDYS